MHVHGIRIGIVVTLVCTIAAMSQAAPAEASSVLCKVNAGTCFSPNIWPLGTEFTVTQERPVLFEMAFNKLECAESPSKIVTEGTDAEGNVYGTWRNLAFGSCMHSEGSFCESAEARNLPWKVVFKAGAESSENRIAISSSGKGEPRLRVSCALGSFTCTYGGAGETSIGMFPTEGRTHIFVQVVRELVEGGFACASYKPIRWLAEYQISPEAFLTH